MGTVLGCLESLHWTPSFPASSALHVSFILTCRCILTLVLSPLLSCHWFISQTCFYLFVPLSICEVLLIRLSKTSRIRIAYVSACVFLFIAFRPDSYLPFVFEMYLPSLMSFRKPINTILSIFNSDSMKSSRT